MIQRGLQVLERNQERHQPLVFHQDCTMALLKWEPLFDIGRLGEIERHNATNEVFVLFQGHAVIFAIDGQDLQIGQTKHVAMYRVQHGIWHGLLATRPARSVSVEGSGYPLM